MSLILHLAKKSRWFFSHPPKPQIKAFLSLPSCHLHLHKVSLIPQCRRQTQASSPTPGAAVFSMYSYPTPARGEEAQLGDRKEEQHLETGQPGTWERVRSPFLPGRGGSRHGRAWQRPRVVRQGQGNCTTMLLGGQ